MKAIFSFVALSLFCFANPAMAGSQSCQNAIAESDYARMCHSCHRLPVTKRECLEAGNFERAKACFQSLGDVISFHGPAIYRACYAAPSAEVIFTCARLKYHSRQYHECLQQ